jgi:membrane-anchored glycerophosphoryl diester phosphodiesterase (GDPDase)
MDFKHHIETAWNLTLKNLVALILITLVMVGVSTFSLGILAPVTFAGYTQSLLLLVRQGREPNVRDLFSRMKLFLPLLGFGIAVFVAVSIGFMLLLIPGLIIVLAITFCCIYMIPLMTDRGLGLVAAIKESCAMARRGDLLDHVVVVVIFLVISMIGGSVFIGTLLTQPLATLFLLSVYEEKSRPAAPGQTEPPAPPLY